MESLKTQIKEKKSSTFSIILRGQHFRATYRATMLCCKLKLFVARITATEFHVVKGKRDVYFLQHENLLHAQQTISTCNTTLLPDELHENVARITGPLITPTIFTVRPFFSSSSYCLCAYPGIISCSSYFRFDPACHISSGRGTSVFLYQHVKTLDNLQQTGKSNRQCVAIRD